MGISRADLWAFAGLVALDRVQEQSRSLCESKELSTPDHHNKITCDDWKSSCWAPFPKKSTKKLFRTGRKDCIPNKKASIKQRYLASKLEAHPDQNGNGEKTVQYFKDKFKLNPREALALMGAHTLGRYSTFQTHLDYAWVRDKESRRNEVLNNEYYKILAGRPGRVKDNFCVGTMNGSIPVHDWYVKNLQFEKYWPQEGLWINKTRRLNWNQFVTRGPQCVTLPKTINEDKETGRAAFWAATLSNGKKTKVFPLEQKVKKRGYDSFWDYCCKKQEEGCGKKGNTMCDSECDRPVNNRLRLLSADVGLYLKWDTDEYGYPTTEHCDAFKDMGTGYENDSKWSEMRNLDANHKTLTLESRDRFGGCPKQDLKDEYGKELSGAVELYADDQEKWIKDFVKVWGKMNQLNTSGLKRGPSNFWSHLS